MLERETANAADFCDLARAIGLYKNTPTLHQAVQSGLIRVSDRVKGILAKAAVSGGSTGDATWAGALTAYQTISAGFVESLRSISVFDSMLPNLRRIPPFTRAAIVTTGASGALTAEQKWKVLSKLSLAADNIAPLKAVTVLVITEELLRFSTAGTDRLFADELRSAVAQATDAPVLTALLALTTPAASSGNARHDIATLLAAVPLKALSRPMFLTTPLVLQQMAALHGDSGPVFPDLSVPSGGFISGIPTVGCDGLSNYGGHGDHLLLVDCWQCAGESSVVTIDGSVQADIQMSDAPTDGAADMVSMFETNAVAIKCERRYAFARLRASAVAALKTVAYGVGSP
jgi:HK97 family phage major capsid protein